MSEVVQLAPPLAESTRWLLERDAPVVRTDAVHVVFTTPAETLAAVRVAAALGRRLGAPLRVIQFRAVPYPLAVDEPAGVSPVETETFVEKLKAEGIDVRVRVYLCRSDARLLPKAFKRHSVVVIGGRRSWWPTASERLRRRLEAAGHFVVFVEAAEHQERSRA